MNAEANRESNADNNLIVGSVPKLIYTPPPLGGGHQAVATESLTTDRQAYMRKHQQAFRQRKQKYIEDLERRCNEQRAEISRLNACLDLTASMAVAPRTTGILASATPSPPASTVAVEFDTTRLQCSDFACFTHLAALEAQIENLRAEKYRELINVSRASWHSDSQSVTNLTSISRIPLTTMSAFGSNQNEQAVMGYVAHPPATFLSAVQLYGAPNIGNYFENLASIISPLSDTKVVDRIKKIYDGLVRSIDTNTARSLVLRLLREHNRLFDLCNIVERAQISDLLAEYVMATQKHSAQFTLILNARSTSECPPTFSTIPESEWPLRVQKIKAEIKKVPSLSRAESGVFEPCINLLCNYWAQPEFHELNTEEFFQLHKAVQTISSFVDNVEDMRQLLLTAEILRESSKRELVR
ncbi:hypothetical protein HK100_004914, partial [Physocladia obscura]